MRRGVQQSVSIIQNCLRSHQGLQFSIAPALACMSNSTQVQQSSAKRSFQSSAVQYQENFQTQRDSSGLILPHGGKPVSSMLHDAAQKNDMLSKCTKTLQLSDRNACDVEVLCVGGFAPLTGFMNSDEYTKCVDDMRLPSGLLFGLPVVLDTSDPNIKVGDYVKLQYGSQAIGVMKVEDKFTPNKAKETRQCYGTSSLEHPGTLFVATERGQWYLGGPVWGLELPQRPFPCRPPAEVRASLPANTDVVAFQCRNPIHKAHYELLVRALDAQNVAKDGVVFVHPTCGPTQDDDIPGDVRYLTYKVLIEEANNPRFRWDYLPYSMHMAGPREAIQHMIIRKNYGATHFIIGRDMAGSKSSITKDDFYGAYDAQDMAKQYSQELGVKTVPSLNVVYTEEKGYVTADVADKEGLKVKKLSGTKFREMLRAGDDIPEWFAFPSVVKVLREQASK